MGDAALPELGLKVPLQQVPMYISRVTGVLAFFRTKQLKHTELTTLCDFID